MTSAKTEVKQSALGAQRRACFRLVEAGQDLIAFELGLERGVRF